MTLKVLSFKYIIGPPIGRDLPIKFDFTDTPNQATPPGWKFEESMMPKLGSEWILFIVYAAAHDGMFETFQGAKGRVEYNDKSLMEVQDDLDKRGMQCLIDKH